MEKVMRLLTIVLSFLSWVVLASACFASPLEIEISLNENPSANELVKDLSSLVMATSITNVSENDQIISVWLCSYGASWVANTPVMLTGLESCHKNYPMDVVLKPQESYSRDLIVTLSSRAQEGPLTFQLGFNLKNDWFGTRRGIVSDKQQILADVLWSNPVTIEVTSAITSALREESDELVLKSNDEFQRHGVRVNCAKDEDCWCRNFQGSYFVEGKRANTCNQQTHVCAECVYE